MITTILTMLVVAALFVVFGWTRKAEGGCGGCHHAGSAECGPECPVLKETMEKLESTL